VEDAFAVAGAAIDAHRGDYTREAMPSPLDGVLFDLVSAFVDAGRASRRHVLARLTARQRRILSAFGIRLGSMAVREDDTDLLELALVACGLGWPVVAGGREFLVEMAPLYDAALKLAVRPSGLFERSAAVVGVPAYGQALTELAARGDGFATLTSRGWREVIGPDGFRYEFSELGR
jgi:hypothetical protein